MSAQQIETDVQTCEDEAVVEQWRPIVGCLEHEGRPLYEISDQGRVRSWAEHSSRVRIGQVVRTEPKLLTPGLSERTRYLATTVRSREHKSMRIDIHAAVLTAFVGPRPQGKQGAHLNGQSRDNRLVNLAWKTPIENAQDKRVHGTEGSGESNPRADLTEFTVRALRTAAADLRRRGEPVVWTHLAEQFGSTPGAVFSAVRGETWTHLPGALSDLPRRRYRSRQREERRLKVHEAARRACVSVQTLRTWTGSGEVAMVGDGKRNYIDVESLWQFVAQNFGRRLLEQGEHLSALRYPLRIDS